MLKVYPLPNESGGSSHRFWIVILHEENYFRKPKTVNSQNSSNISLTNVSWLSKSFKIHCASGKHPMKYPLSWKLIFDSKLKRSKKKKGSFWETDQILTVTFKFNETFLKNVRATLSDWKKYWRANMQVTTLNFPNRHSSEPSLSETWTELCSNNRTSVNRSPRVPQSDHEKWVDVFLLEWHQLKSIAELTKSYFWECPSDD